jgi:flagellar motor switch protein FliG
MGAVFRPKDLPAGWRKVARESIKDLSPDTTDNVIKIIDSWQGTKSEEKLKELLGHDKAESFMKKITRTTTTTKNKAALTSDEQNQIKDMFRESLTFD